MGSCSCSSQGHVAEPGRRFCSRAMDKSREPGCSLVCWRVARVTNSAVSSAMEINFCYQGFFRYSSLGKWVFFLLKALAGSSATAAPPRGLGAELLLVLVSRGRGLEVVGAVCVCMRCCQRAAGTAPGTVVT